MQIWKLIFHEHVRSAEFISSVDLTPSSILAIEKCMPYNILQIWKVSLSIQVELAELISTVDLIPSYIYTIWMCGLQAISQI